MCNWIGIARPVSVSDCGMAACCLCGQRFILSAPRQDMLCKSIEFPMQYASNYTPDDKSGRSVTITSSGALPPFPCTYFWLDAYWCRGQFMPFSLSSFPVCIPQLPLSLSFDSYPPFLLLSISVSSLIHLIGAIFIFMPDVNLMAPMHVKCIINSTEDESI